MKYTIFTPLYNRANLISRVYESLKRQKIKDFEWIVVDDGSTDGADIIISEWPKSEKDFSIRYFYKENGGKHTAINMALSHARGDFFLICDSDDYFMDNALTIADKWIRDVNNFESPFENYIGVAGQKITPAGDLMIWRTDEKGNTTPYGGKLGFENYRDSTSYDMGKKYGLMGGTWLEYLELECFGGIHSRNLKEKIF